MATVHLDYDAVTNHEDARLAALCAACHGVYDELVYRGRSREWDVPYVRISEIREALTREAGQSARA
tara:strand:+ start:774 stop:974 length:201 start_codon:yes stop_codon:yes gene_type:complete